MPNPNQTSSDHAQSTTLGDSGIKLSATICFLLLAIGVFAAWDAPATEYEPSIYKGTPFLFWIASALALTCGIVIVVHQLCRNKHNTSRLWMIGGALIFLAFTSVLSLWIIRGYALWSPGDPFTHLGELQYVLDTGHFQDDLTYPAMSCALAQVSLICDVGPLMPYKLAPLLFAMMSVPFTYLFAKSILPQRDQRILAVLLSMTFLTHWYLNLTPNCLANLFLPLALYIAVKNSTSSSPPWQILFFLLLILYPVFHPVPSLALMLFLLAFWIPSRMPYLRGTRLLSGTQTTVRATRADDRRVAFLPPAVLFLLLWSVVWYSRLAIFETTLKSIYNSITQGGDTHLADLEVEMDKGTGFGYSITEQFLRQHGGVVVLALFALVAFFMLLRRAKREPTQIPLVSLYAPLVTISVAIIVLYGLNLAFSPLRLLTYVVLLCIPLSVPVLTQLITMARRLGGSQQARIVFPFAVISILLALFLAGTLVLFPSPYILADNDQVPKADVEGMNWALHEKDTGQSITGLTLVPWRYADLLLPMDRADRPGIPVRKEQVEVPNHFGYDTSSTLADHLYFPIYLVLDRQDIVHFKTFPERAPSQFLLEDFDHLQKDISVSRLYSNERFEVYHNQPPG